MPLSDKPVRFRVVVHWMALLDRGCPASGRRDPDHCRACSVGHDLLGSGMELRWMNNEMGDERIVVGVARTTEQKHAMTRLIAWAYGHPEPVLENRPEKMSEPLVSQ